MAFYEITIAPKGPSFVQEVSLDGTTYRLLFRWNTRAGYWFLTISTIEDVIIAPSRKLVPGASLLRHVADRTVRPPGALYVVGTPGRDDLGVDTFLIYADAETVAAGA